MNEIANKLISWYLINKRDMPWRKTRDPYRIWLSEIMLQQTRVAQGIPYYMAFTEAFPSVHDLAKADEEMVLKLWQGLGYYSRARNLHSTAKYVSKELNGIFPNNYKDLLNLKGVGDYTASAIASICFEEPKAVLDGNVFRVLSRLFNVFTPINSPKGKKEFGELADSVLDKKQPATYNQAIMEFGALQCKPQNPSCDSCVLNNNCEAYHKKKVSELPVKLKKLKVKKIYFNYIVPLTQDNRTLLNKRNEKGIWANLYEFPLLETLEQVEGEELLLPEKLNDICLKDTKAILFNKNPIIHKLSHRHIYTKFWMVEISDLPSRAVAFSEIEKYPVPVLIANFIKDFGKNN